MDADVRCRPGVSLTSHPLPAVPTEEDLNLSGARYWCGSVNFLAAIAAIPATAIFANGLLIKASMPPSFRCCVAVSPGVFEPPRPRKPSRPPLP